MATTYDVLLSDGTGCGTRARKDAAIKLGELQEQPFTVVSSSGQVVFDSEATGTPAEAPAPATTPAEAPAPATTPAEAPAPATTPKKEKPVTTTKTEAPAKTGPSNELEFSHGAKYFFRPMGESAVKVAEGHGLSATLEKGNIISVSGSDVKTRRTAIKEIDAFLTAQYAAFKAWKKGQRDSRKEFYGTPEGRKAMTQSENEFFQDYTARYLAGEIDDAEGVI